MKSDAHLAHEAETRLQREPARLRVLGDRHALDELHHEVRLPALGGATVVDARDAVVVHQRERLTLLLEARDDLAAVHAELDQLERDATPDRLVLLSEEDLTHAPGAEPFENGIGADAARAAASGVGLGRSHADRPTIARFRLPASAPLSSLAWVRSRF